MASITRGTTPTVTCTVGMDLTDYSCYLSIGKKAKSPWMTADNEQMEFGVSEGTSTLAFTLTQAQTLACKAGPAQIQLRVVKDGVAIASDMAPITIDDIIKDGEIEDVYDTD